MPPVEWIWGRNTVSSPDDHHRLDYQHHMEHQIIHFLHCVRHTEFESRIFRVKTLLIDFLVPSNSWQLTGMPLDFYIFVKFRCSMMDFRWVNCARILCIFSFFLSNVCVCVCVSSSLHSIFNKFNRYKLRCGENQCTLCALGVPSVSIDSWKEYRRCDGTFNAHLLSIQHCAASLKLCSIAIVSRLQSHFVPDKRYM